MDSARCSGPFEKILPAPGTNQIPGFVEFRPLTSRKKDKKKYSHLIFSPGILLILMLSIKMEEEAAIADVMNILESESKPSRDYREQLAVLVASGNAKEMTGVNLTQDHVKGLSEKDGEKNFKTYETSLSSKTCDAMVATFLQLSCRLISIFSLLIGVDY